MPLLLTLRTDSKLSLYPIALVSSPLIVHEIKSDSITYHVFISLSKAKALFREVQNTKPNLIKQDFL